MTSPGRLAVLASGDGSNLQAILDACSEGRLDAEVVIVASNNPQAFALQRAERAGVATLVAPHQDRNRGDYDTELAYAVATHRPDLVVLAGWNRLLTSNFVSHHITINLHPAKPGAFPGLGAIEKAFDAWREGRIDHGGVMVHYVPDEGVDNGPLIGWERVPFEVGDNLDTYEARVHQVEHRLLVDCIGIALTTLSGSRKDSSIS